VRVVLWKAQLICYGDPSDAKRNATLELLRRRLADVYAEGDIVVSSTPPTDDMIIE
jgi:hypothetical protein